jgi:hypothetical protein
MVSPSKSAKNLGMTLDNTLSFSANIKVVTHSFRFMLYNTRRVRPYLIQEAAQVLIQALVISRLDLCNSLLAGLPVCAMNLLQLTQSLDRKQKGSRSVPQISSQIYSIVCKELSLTLCYHRNHEEDSSGISYSILCLNVTMFFFTIRIS